MKTLPVRAGRSASFTGILNSLLGKASANGSKIASKSLALASISATGCYLGAILGSDFIMYAAGTAALILIYLSDKKGSNERER